MIIPTMWLVAGLLCFVLLYITFTEAEKRISWTWLILILLAAIFLFSPMSPVHIHF